MHAPAQPPLMPPSLASLLIELGALAGTSRRLEEMVRATRRGMQDMAIVQAAALNATRQDGASLDVPLQDLRRRLGVLSTETASLQSLADSLTEESWRVFSEVAMVRGSDAPQPTTAQLQDGFSTVERFFRCFESLGLTRREIAACVDAVEKLESSGRPTQSQTGDDLSAKRSAQEVVERLLWRLRGQCSDDAGQA